MDMIAWYWNHDETSFAFDILPLLGKTKHSAWNTKLLAKSTYKSNIWHEILLSTAFRKDKRR